MKPEILLFLFLTTFMVSAQEYTNRRPLGLYTSLDAGIGYDLAAIIRTASTDKDDIYNPNSPYYSQHEPGRLNYGFTYMVGYQPINRLSLAGGFRYSYVNPDFHILYALAQANVYVGALYDEDFQYIFVRGGGMLNHSEVSGAGFVSVGFGKMEPLGKHFGHFFQIFIESQHLDRGTAFLGLSYGVIVFGNSRR